MNGLKCPFHSNKIKRKKLIFTRTCQKRLQAINVKNSENKIRRRFLGEFIRASCPIKSCTIGLFRRVGPSSAAPGAAPRPRRGLGPLRPASASGGALSPQGPLAPGPTPPAPGSDSASATAGSARAKSAACSQRARESRPRRCARGPGWAPEGPGRIAPASAGARRRGLASSRGACRVRGGRATWANSCASPAQRRRRGRAGDGRTGREGGPSGSSLLRVDGGGNGNTQKDAFGEKEPTYPGTRTLGRVGGEAAPGVLGKEEVPPRPLPDEGGSSKRSLSFVRRV